jgi:type I restriction enzyme R subunit
LLQRETAAMNLDNFVVRPRRRIVEKYAKPEAWAVLSPEALSALSHEVAGCRRNSIRRTRRRSGSTCWY